MFSRSRAAARGGTTVKPAGHRRQQWYAWKIMSGFKNETSTCQIWGTPILRNLNMPMDLHLEIDPPNLLKAKRKENGLGKLMLPQSPFQNETSPYNLVSYPPNFQTVYVQALRKSPECPATRAAQYFRASFLKTSRACKTRPFWDQNGKNHQFSGWL